MSPKRVSDRVSMVIPSPFGGVQLGDHTIDVLTVKRQTEPVRGAIHAQFGDLAGEEGFEPSIPCSRGRCLTVRLLANATRPPEYRISAPDGERPRATNIRSSAAISCGIVVFGHRKGVETKRHTTLPLIGSRRERFAEAAREGVFFVRTRQDAGLRRLQPGIRVHRERTAVLRRPAVQRAASLPVVPSSQEAVSYT